MYIWNIYKMSKYIQNSPRLVKCKGKETQGHLQMKCSRQIQPTLIITRQGNTKINLMCKFTTQKYVLKYSTLLNHLLGFRRNCNINSSLTTSIYIVSQKTVVITSEHKHTFNLHPSNTNMDFKRKSKEGRPLIRGNLWKNLSQESATLLNKGPSI